MYLWVSKNHKKIREYIHTPWILLQSFGKKCVVFWTTEKKIKILAVCRIVKLIFLSEICLFVVAKNTMYFSQNFYRAFRMCVRISVFFADFSEHQKCVFNFFEIPVAMSSGCCWHFSNQYRLVSTVSGLMAFVEFTLCVAHMEGQV